jgi:O-antigen/teichoic acid export membrane protein
MSFNLGIPGGLFARIDGRVNADRQVNSRYVTSAFGVTVRVCAVWILGAVATVVCPVAWWLRLDGVIGSGGAVARVFLCATALMLVINLAQPVYFALFRSHQAYTLAALVHVAAVPCALAAAKFKPAFWILSAVFLSPPILAGFSLLWLAIQRGYIELGTSERESRHEFMRFSARYFAVEALTAVMLRLPETMVSYTRGFVEAGHFSAYVRFPLLLSSVSALILQPLWPALVVAIREFNTKEASVMIRRWLHTVLILWTLFAAAVLLLGRTFVATWLGAAHTFAYGTLMLAVLFGLAQGLHFWTVLVLLGLGDLRASLKVNTVMVCLYFPLVYVLTARFAAAGTFVALIFVFGVVGAPLGVRAYRARLRQLEADSGSA